MLKPEGNIFQLLKRQGASLLGLWVIFFALLSTALPAQDSIQLLDADEEQSIDNESTLTGHFIGIPHEIETKVFFDETENEEEEDDDVHAQSSFLNGSHSANAALGVKQFSELGYFPNHNKLFILYQSWKSFLA